MPFINNTWQPRRFPNNGPPIKVLKYREKHNISPDVKLSDDDDRKASLETLNSYCWIKLPAEIDLQIIT